MRKARHCANYIGYVIVGVLGRILPGDQKITLPPGKLPYVVLYPPDLQR